MSDPAPLSAGSPTATAWRCFPQLLGVRPRPKYVVIADHSPKNPSGKILKRELRDRHAGLADEVPVG